MPEEPRPAFDYDELVDWSKRLDREAPFFRDLFERVGVRRLADVGCGSGMHDILFASWGIDVLGVDPDEGMLAQARANAQRAGAQVRFERGGFGGLRNLLDEPVDAVVSLGNALPHVEGIAGLGVALDDIAHVLRPGGALVLHLLNHARLLANRPKSLPPAIRETADQKKVFLKLLDYVDGDIFMEFLRLSRPHSPAADGDESGGWRIVAKRSLHTPLPATLLAEELDRAGFTAVTLFGAHDGRDFSPMEDESLLLTARRAE